MVAPEDGGAFCSCCRGENRCTVARAKTCAKIFLAQLFSHVGLCALVVGYAIMGAFIFMALERGKEFETRSGKTSISLLISYNKLNFFQFEYSRDKVKAIRDDTLDQLYNITGRKRTKDGCRKKFKIYLENSFPHICT